MSANKFAFVSALAVGLGFGPAAFAADDTTWTGWYVGATVGGAWSNDPVVSVFSCSTAGVAFCPYNVPANLAAAGAAGTGTLSKAGFSGGAEVGYNWQLGSFVLGAETDFESFKVAPSLLVTGPFPASFTS